MWTITLAHVVTGIITTIRTTSRRIVDPCHAVAHDLVSGQEETVTIAAAALVNHAITIRMTVTNLALDVIVLRVDRDAVVPDRIPRLAHDRPGDKKNNKTKISHVLRVF